MKRGDNLLYENIKRLCEKNGICIYALEKECGIGNGTIGKLANAKRSPRIDTLQKISKKFGVSIDELLNEGGA